MTNKQLEISGREEHTHANEASSIVPTDQNIEKITIQIPLFGAGTNSRNQDEYTGPPPRPTPTNILKIIRIT